MGAQIQAERAVGVETTRSEVDEAGVLAGDRRHEDVVVGLSPGENGARERGGGGVSSQNSLICAGISVRAKNMEDEGPLEAVWRSRSGSPQ